MVTNKNILKTHFEHGAGYRTLLELIFKIKYFIKQRFLCGKHPEEINISYYKVHSMIYF